MFHLSAEQFAREPADKFFINWFIYGQLKEREAIAQRHTQLGQNG